MRLLLCLALLAIASCSVNDYCLNCARGDGGGGSNDGGEDGGVDDGGTGDGGPCIASGPEICDGKDNDCNGLVDDGVLPDIGTLCDNQKGACAGGVKVCTNGAIKCSKSPTPETCDNVDNDCNGLIDEGDPGGGGKCGTDVGECTAGANHCVSGAIVCQGYENHTGDPELCDAKDNDCDGNFDEGLTNMGSCGVKTCVGGTKKGAVCQTTTDCNGSPCSANVGLCHTGTLSCQGGAQQCNGFTTPSFELCDHLDNDCDGSVDEGFNTLTDINNCGACGTSCALPASFHTIPTCAAGTCGFTCAAGYYNNDGNAANGCESQCNPSPEVCDGIDNDCDGTVDEQVGTPPAICSTIGECAVNSAVTCDAMNGWVCHYGSTVSLNSDGTIKTETLCDGKDNDCNGIIDDGQPTKGAACDDGKKGECRSYGTNVCDSANLDGPAVCSYSHTGTPVAAESCNNLDDDCDGVIDNTTTAGVFPATAPGLEWIAIGGGHQMMKYEASKPDATATDGGNVVSSSCGSSVAISSIAESGTTALVTTPATHSLPVGRVIAISGTSVAGYNKHYVIIMPVTATTFTITAASGLGSATGGTATPQCPVCSSASKVPWTNVTYGNALAACKAVGASLCGDVQWHRACSVVTPTTYPVTVATSASVTIEAEDYYAITPGTDGSHAWIEDYTLGYSSISDMQAGPDNGAATTTAATAVATSPRLDYQLTIATAGTYRVCVRAYANNNAARRVWAGLGATAGAGTPLAITNSAGNGAWNWALSGAFTVAAGTNYLSIYMEDDGARLDQVFVTSGTTCPTTTTITSPGNTWAYATNPSTYQATTCNGHDYDAATDATLPTGSLASCYSTVASNKAYDMSGNVKEWTLAQQTGQNPIRGGASNNTDVGTSCALNFTLANDSFFFPNVGFRCCK